VAHPLLFREDDPMLARIRRIALSFPGAAEKISHGRPAFYTTKIFAYYGASVKVDDLWIQHDQSIVVLPDPIERRALLGDSRVYVPGYLGGYGWIGFDLAIDRVGWDEVGELIDSSYRSTCSKRLVAELDSTR
jgi:YjbR